MNPDIQNLQNQIDMLQRKVNTLYNSSTIDRNVETAFIERLGLTNFSRLSGIVEANNTLTPKTITPLAGLATYYVAVASGGLVTRRLTFTDGILTSDT